MVKFTNENIGGTLGVGKYALRGTLVNKYGSICKLQRSILHEISRNGENNPVQWGIVIEWISSLQWKRYYWKANFLQDSFSRL